MRRTWLQGIEKARKRYLIAAAAHNLVLLMHVLFKWARRLAAGGHCLIYVFSHFCFLPSGSTAHSWLGGSRGKLPRSLEHRDRCRRLGRKREKFNGLVSFETRADVTTQAIAELTAMVREHNSSRTTGRLFGYDIMRFLAVGMVVWQHAQSLHGLTPRHLLPGLDIGQLGVAVFSGISGHFAFNASQQSTAAWLLRRLVRIYIPLWLTLLILFSANSIIHHKSTDLWLVLSEFAGTGGFTHGSRLVGVHLWFISLILLCYLFAAFLRMFPWIHGPMIVVVAAAAWHHVPFASYLLAFLFTGLVCKSRHRIAVNILFVSGTAFICCDAQLRGVMLLPTLVGLVTVLIAEMISFKCNWPKGWKWPSMVSEATYHFYLMHGPIFHGLALAGGFGLTTDTLVGSLLTTIAAWLLYTVDRLIRDIVSVSFRRLSTVEA